MKLRVRFNSVRFRLTKTEVSTLQGFGECSELIKFPGGACLAYSLKVSEDSDVHAAFEQGTVKISVPQKDIHAWSTTDAVGIYATVDAAGEKLGISVEKDFQCLDLSTLEDQSDMFSNPATGSLSC
jgi:hypothetical protein